MSRLIFEGNTTERFGKIFPKPYIEEIRVFDDSIAADIAFYFEIEEDVEVTDFLTDTGLDELLIYTGVTTEPQINNQGIITQVLGLSGGLSQFIESLQFKYFSLQDIGEESTFNNFQNLSSAQNSFFYSNDGKKFVKFLITDTTNKNYDFQGSGFGDDVSELLFARYLICLNFYPDSDFSSLMAFDSESMSTDQEQALNFFKENVNLFSNQFSDVSYDKFLNIDQTLNTGRQVVYIESDGNYYTQIPLISLDRIYRKVNLVNHSEVISRFQTVISPFINEIEEANLISSTLQENANNPRLLLLLQRNINNFSNKSTATTIGTLYGNLVDLINELNNTLIRSEQLEKRLESSNKIKDFRELKIISTEQLKIPLSQRRLNINSLDRNFLSLSFLTRQVFPTVNAVAATRGAARTDLDDFIIENTGYVFFDYEKALNYKSNISEFFNPYNILHIFGKNCLNEYFYIKEIEIRKMTGQGLDVKAITLKTNSNPDFSTDPVKTKMVITAHRPGNSLHETIYPASQGTLIKSMLAERAAAALQGRDNYRLRVFEFMHIESVEQAVAAGRYEIDIHIVDRTMRFFLEHFHDKMRAMVEELKQYLLFAEQFCSYNNIDGRFNDFFSNAMIEQFSEPYIWEESPKFYYAMSSILNMSWNNDGDINTRRKKDGSLANLEQLSNLAIVTHRQINPVDGNLNDLRIFVEKFETFFENYIGYGSAWSDQIYVANGTFNESVSLSPDVLSETNKLLSINPSIITEIIDSYDLENYSSDEPGEPPTTSVTSEAFIRAATQPDRLSITDAPKQDPNFSQYGDFFDHLSLNLNIYFYTKPKGSVPDSENPFVRIDSLNSSLEYENEFTQNLALYLDEDMSTNDAWSSLISFLGDGDQVSSDIMLGAMKDRNEVIQFVDFMRIFVPLYEFENERYRLDNLGQLLESVKIWGEF